MMIIKTHATNRFVVRLLTMALLGGALLSSTGCFLTGPMWRWATGRPVRTWADTGPAGVYFKIADCKEHPDGWYVYRNGSLQKSGPPKAVRDREFKIYDLWWSYWKVSSRQAKHPIHKVRSHWESGQLIQEVMRKESRRARWVREAEIRLTPKEGDYGRRKVVAACLTPVTIALEIATIALRNFIILGANNH